MPRRNDFRPEDREPDVEIYNVAPPVMPPSPAGANVEIGGEAAASRRVAGLPPGLADDPDHTAGTATPGEEPFLGYDGLDLDRVLDWIRDADPDPDQLRAILAYEKRHFDREAIVEECRDRLQRLGEPPES